MFDLKFIHLVASFKLQLSNVYSLNWCLFCSYFGHFYASTEPQSQLKGSELLETYVILLSKNKNKNLILK